MEDGFRDLAPLDPMRDPARWERMVAGVTAAAAPELARRARMPAPGLLWMLSDWMRPTVSAAALMAAAAGAFLWSGTADATADTNDEMSAALGYPAEVATMAETGTASSLEELVLSLEGDTP